jgi:hypothetical protein
MPPPPPVPLVLELLVELLLLDDVVVLVAPPCPLLAELAVLPAPLPLVPLGGGESSEVAQDVDGATTNAKHAKASDADARRCMARSLVSCLPDTTKKEHGDSRPQQVRRGAGAHSR